MTGGGVSGEGQRGGRLHTLESGHTDLALLSMFKEMIKKESVLLLLLCVLLCCKCVCGPCVCLVFSEAERQILGICVLSKNK